MDVYTSLSEPSFFSRAPQPRLPRPRPTGVHLDHCRSLLTPSPHPSTSRLSWVPLCRADPFPILSRVVSVELIGLSQLATGHSHWLGWEHN